MAGAAIPKGSDKWANLAGLSVTMTGTDTLTTKSFNFPFSIMDKVGIIISRLEYNYGALQQLNSANDYVVCGLCAATTVASATDITDPVIVDTNKIVRIDIGTAASGMLFQDPFVKDFSSLPGGGILVAPAPLYVFITSSGAAGAMSVNVRMYYTYLKMVPEDYWELVESRRIVSG